MTGKAELMRLMNAARQEMLRRQIKGLPYACAKAKVNRAEALWDTMLRRKEEKQAREIWTAHTKRIAGYLNRGDK